MKKVTKFNFRTLLVLFLSIALCLSTALSVACNNDNNSSSSSSATEEETVYPTDTQAVLNGDFEFSTFTKDDDDFPVASSISWVRSSDSITTSAVSSSYTSGIINTAEEAYKTIASAAGFHKIADSEEYFNPKTPYAYGLISDEETYVYSEELENEDKLVMTGDKILMIHNEVKGSDGKGNGEGTAQKFTSSASLSLARNQFAKITVWVLTHDLVSAYADTEDFGAYIAIQNTVSTATTPLVIKNINTNSQWAKYTVYLSSSDFSTSSFKVVLGLGFGSKEIRREYVEGFAYFDNVHYETISKADYEAGIAGAVDCNLYDSTTYEVKEDLTVSEDGIVYNENSAETNNYTERTFNLSHTRANKFALNAYENGTVKNNEYVENQAQGIATKDTLANALTAVNGYLGAGNEISAPIANDTLSALYFLHANPTSTTYTTKEFEVAEGSYFKYTFWAKISTQYPTDNALTVTLNDIGLGSSKAVKTVIASNVNTDEYENEDYNDWRQYVVFISNTLDADSNVNETRKFTLTFDFGTTAASVTDGSWGLTQGYAIITDLEGYEMTEKDYNLADLTSYSYSKKIALSADRPNGIESEDTSKDSYTFTHGANDNNVIKNNVATNVITYSGIVGNSTFVGGTDKTAYSHADVVAGLVNSQYANNYSSDIKDALSGLGTIGENEYVQPLLIKTTGTTSFGYVGANSSISANSITIISVKVKVVGDAEAYIYIANSNALDRFNVLGISAEGKVLENDVLVDNDAGDVNQLLVIKVTANDMNAEYLEDGWLTVRFAICTGNESLAYRTELWNGERDGEAKSGIVLFDGYSATSATSLVDLRNELAIDYPNDTVTEIKYTRVPTLITYTDENGDKATKYKTYDESVVFESFAGSKTVIADLTTIHVENEIDKTDSTDDEIVEDSSSSESTEENSFSWALQITSIIISAVLIALLLVVLGKIIYDKYRKKKGASVSYYNRNSRERAGLAIEEKNARKAKEESKVKPYDYDNMENNVEVETEEEIVEESIEEPVEESTETADEEEKPEENGENN